MKKFKHTIIATVLVFAFVFGAGNTFAQENIGAVLQEKVAELRQTHKELKAQVDAGEITKEEARNKWKEVLADFRQEKEEFFESRIEKIEDKYKELLEKNPERAALLKERIDAVKERHNLATEKRTELRAKVESGEITRAEARVQKIEFVKNQKAAYQNFRENLKEKREEFRENREEQPTGLARPIDAALEATDYNSSRSNKSL